MAISYAVIELDNLVLSALRCFTISSLRGGRTAGGRRVLTRMRFGHEEEVAAFILSVLNSVLYAKLRSPARVSRRDEPTVRDPRDTEKILLTCGASNVGSLQNALALNTSIFRDLSALRNFYAHRNADTWRKLKTKAASWGVLSPEHADDIARSTLSGRPVTLFEDWLDDAELFFDELTL